MAWTETTFTTIESIVLRQNDSYYYFGSYYLGYVKFHGKLSGFVESGIKSDFVSYNANYIILQF